MKSARVVACLLVVSGWCALVYQLAWLREFRLIFGTSTAASAAVLGVFMGGLGLGGILLGRRADRAPVPLALYGWLEVGIAAAAALSPVLVTMARALYLATGGSMAWGSVMGTGLRILLAAVVLAAPTFLMGGTFPQRRKQFHENPTMGGAPWPSFTARTRSVRSWVSSRRHFSSSSGSARSSH